MLSPIRQQPLNKLCNSLVWQSITGHLPPYPPPTAKSYSKAGLPWFDYYQDGVEALPGGDTLAELKSVSQKSQAEGDSPLPEIEPFHSSPNTNSPIKEKRKASARNEMIRGKTLLV